MVGLGRMGAAMARRVHDHTDAELVLYNRSADKAKAVADDTGAEVAATPAAAAEGVDVVVVSLADDAAILDAYRGDDGLIAGLAAGAVVCDTSTVDPETMRELAPEVRAAGAELLDTPVSGSVPVVEQGELTVMVGGSADALAVAQPVLDAFSKQTFHLGDIGAGATMKLVVNSMVAAINSALSEALVLAERAGLDREATYDVISSSAAGSPYVGYKRDAFVDPENAPIGFTLALVAKDQGLIHALAERVGASLPQGTANQACVEAAVAAGLGERDMSALAEYLR